MTINADVDVAIQNHVTDGSDGSENNFVIVILVVIVCAILVIAGFFIVRLLMTKRQRKYVIEEMNQAEITGTNANLGGRGALKKQSSQPKMDDQYVVDNLDCLELTKKKTRKDQMLSYGALPNHSDRGDSSCQSVH